MGVTMRDVAVKAGVSQQAVSAALGDKGGGVRVGEETRRRILAVSKELGYRPNALARSMKTGKSKVIGFLGNLIGESYAQDMLAGACQAAQLRGYLVKLFPLPHGMDAGPIFRQCVEQQLDGVLCRGMGRNKLEALRQELSTHRIPALQVDNAAPLAWRALVGSDDLDGMRQAVTYMAGLGHRRIAHLTAAGDSPFVVLRQKGFALTARELGLDTPEEATLCLPDLFWERQALFLTQVDAYFKRFAPTAVVCATDAWAMLLLDWARRRGVDVPGQLSVVGYGGLDFSSLSSPPLTTVAQPFVAMGARAAEKLLDCVETGVKQEDERLPVKLIVRESSGPNHE